MDGAEINPFDQSLEHQKSTFERLSRDPEWVKEVVEWYKQVYSIMKEDGSNRKDFDSRLVASPDSFPGMISPEILDLPFSQLVVEKLNNNPSLLIDPPRVPPLPLVKTHSDDPFFTSLQSLRFGRSHEEIVDEIRNTKINGLSEAGRLIELLDLNNPDHSVTVDKHYNSLSKISSFMLKVAKELDDALYFRYLLDQAADSIKKIAPSLTSDVNNVLDRTLLIRSKSSNEDLYFVPVGNLFGISVEKDPYEEYFSKFHGFRVSAMGHELLHAVLYRELELPVNKPGYTDRLNKDPLSDEEKVEHSKIRAANLGWVIIEGASIAFEYEFARQTAEQTNEKSLLEESQRFLQNRLVSIRQANRFLFTANEEYIDYEENDLNYSEGFKLAMALKRNGWTLNDLPELVEKVKQIMNEEVGQSPGKELLQIGVSSDKDSLYKKIVVKIRGLRPDVKQV